MANKKVSLLRYTKTDSGWRRFRVSYTRKGKGFVEKLDTNGAVVLEYGAYQLKWYEKGNAVYSGAGDDLRQAINLYDQQVSNLMNKVAGRPVIELPNKRKNIANEAALFVQMTTDMDKAPATATGYRNVIAEFQQVTGLTYIDEIEDHHLTKYCAALSKRKLEIRTITNYFSTLTTFLAHCKVDHMAMLPPSRRPRVKDEKKPVSYSEDDVRSFLAACDTERNRLFFTFLLKTGAREQEASFLEWSDINWKRELVTFQAEKKLDLMIRGKQKEVRFRNKSRKAREVALESNLLQQLKAWRQTNPTSRFVFGTRNDLPNIHFLPICKATAHRAALSCGECKQCLVSKNRNCKHWFLHKFRHTFATVCLRKGIDIMSVKDMMGHAFVQQTAKYVSSDESVQARINVAFSGF